MVFHVFRVVYSVKEMDSHAKHGQSFLKIFWTNNGEFLCRKSYFRVGTSFSWVFFDRGSNDVDQSGTPYMSISPGKARPRTRRPEESETAHINALQQEIIGSAA